MEEEEKDGQSPKVNTLAALTPTTQIYSEHSVYKHLEPAASQAVCSLLGVYGPALMEVTIYFQDRLV